MNFTKGLIINGEDFMPFLPPLIRVNYLVSTIFTGIVLGTKNKRQLSVRQAQTYIYTGTQNK